MSLFLSFLNSLSKAVNQQNDAMELYDIAHPGAREQMSNRIDDLRRRERHNVMMQRMENRPKTTNSQSSNGGGILALGALAAVGIGAVALAKKVLSDDKGNDGTNSANGSVKCKEGVSNTITICPICNAKLSNAEKTCNVCGFQL